MELKFQKRLEEITSGAAQPLTASEWRNWLRASSSSRRISKNIAQASLSFVDAFLAKT